MEQLINYIEQIVKLDDAAKAALHELAAIEHFAKNEFILEPGQRCNKIWFLKAGMVRKFFFHDGKEKTVWITTENEIFTSLQSYAQRRHSDEYLQACEKCEVISISRGNSEKLIRFPAFVTFTNTLMEREFSNIDKNTKALSSTDARGKYEYLKKIAPEMTKRAKLGHIASLLGISQETLSRIRKSQT
ncbi:Crp/Fnr family transcriptional regulator [Maribellus sediminis]|uniref:Crp/Fnr family transcriptional regulator n=1 Tax=Maribellus sediminis TaxID=2696285 RepID=UPI001431197C|nr:Crp/Fnr family transcriptional regulator [Maribellus sediminis]